jgi:hypothetical protein
MDAPSPFAAFMLPNPEPLQPLDRSSADLFGTSVRHLT